MKAMSNKKKGRLHHRAAFLLLFIQEARTLIS